MFFSKICKKEKNFSRIVDMVLLMSVQNNDIIVNVDYLFGNRSGSCVPNIMIVFRNYFSLSLV